MFFNFLKQRGFLYLHTTKGPQALESLAARSNATVHRSLLCFPPLLFFPFSASLLCGTCPDITVVASRILYVVLKDSSHPLEP